MGDGGGTLDASFTGIMNLDQAASHSVTEVSFADVPVGSDGTYGYGTPGDRIQGGFHGPDHAETAGFLRDRTSSGLSGPERGVVGAADVARHIAGHGSAWTSQPEMAPVWLRTVNGAGVRFAGRS